MLDRGVVKARRELVERLRMRRDEVERAVATRVYSISMPAETTDPDYVEGLRASLTDAVDYAFDAIEVGESRASAPSPRLLGQARMAARHGIGLDTVLRRYVAGYVLLIDFVFEEIAGSPQLAESAVSELLFGQAAVFDRLIEAVSEEYGRESLRLRRSRRQRLGDRVRRLLAGESIDASDFGYDVDGFHIGLVLAGTSAGDAVKALSSETGCRLLSIEGDEGRVWAWLGSSSPFAQTATADIMELARRDLPFEVTVALGEAGHGLHGWRLSHRQAVAVLPAARKLGSHVVRYADAGLLTTIERDEVLSHSLRELYVDRLEGERNSGKALRETLRVYLSHGRNVTATAAALAVNRETVRNRLRAAEAKLGRSLDSCAVELDIALRLAETSGSKSPLRLRPSSTSPNRPIL